jgi:lysine-specific demethylase 8
MEHWTSDAYLHERFGDDEVAVDRLTKENRNATGDDMPLSYFLNMYRREPWYAITDLPSAMAAEVQVPAVLAVPAYQRLMQHVVMWLSAADTSSHLHYDNIQNLMCIVDGEKTFIMIDKLHAAHVNIDVHKGDYSAVNPDDIDLQSYPGLETVPWWNASLGPGDCLYIPVNCMVRVFRLKCALEDAIGSHAYSLEANMRVTNDIPPLVSPLLIVVIINYV